MATAIISNGGAAESTGLELSSQYFILPNFSVSARLRLHQCRTDTGCARPVWLRATVRSAVTACPAHRKTRLYLAAHYEMPLNDGSQLDFDWSMSYQSDVLTKVGERDFGESMSGFSLHNVSTSWFKDAVDGDTVRGQCV